MTRTRRHRPAGRRPPAPPAGRWSTRLRLAAAFAAAAVVLAGAAVVHLLGGTARTAPVPAASDPPAAFVGSETCAGCHRAEATLWRRSQHKHRHGARDREDGARRFPRCDASTTYGVRSRFFRKDGKFFVETDGPDGKLATFEVKYTFGVDPLQQYLIEFPGRAAAGAVDRLGQPPEGAGRPALVPSLSERGDPPRRRAALDQAEPELELHVRRVPLDRRAQELRRGERPLRHDLGRDQRRLRGLPRPGLAPCRLGARAAELVALRQGSTTRTRVCRSASTSGATVVWPIDPKTGNAVRSRRARRRCARRSRPAGCATPAAASSPRTGCPGRRLSDTHRVAPLARGLYHADGQMRDEVYNYGSFKQSRMFAAGVTCSDCHEPHGAKLRAPGRRRLPAMPRIRQIRGRCAPPPRGRRPAARLRVLPHAGAHLHGGRPPARSQLAHPAPRPVGAGSARPTPATTAMPTNRRNGRRQRSSAGTDPSARASRIMRERVPRRVGRRARTPRRCSRRSPSDASTPAFARAGALTELASHASPATIDLARDGSRRSRPDGADRRPRHARRRAAGADLAAGRAAPLRRRAAACASGPSRCSPRFRPRSQPPADRERFERAAAEFVAAQRLNADRPEARSTLGNFLRPARPGRGGRGRIQGGAAAEPALCAGGDQSRRSLPAASAAMPTAKACCARRSLPRRGMPACITRSA